MNYNFTYCPFDIEYTEKEVDDMLNELLSVTDNYWHFCNFRNCRMLSIYNPEGTLGKVPLGKKGRFEFTEAGKKCSTLMSFIQDKVLTWMQPEGRITILRTPSNYDMNVHLDCSLKESGNMQHKWRFVLGGDIGGLYFLNECEQQNYIPDSFRSYVLDGGHPHRIAKSDKEKITLCIGAPWTGSSLNNEYTSKLMLEHARYITKPQIREEWIEPRLRYV